MEPQTLTQIGMLERLPGSIWPLRCVFYQTILIRCNQNVLGGWQPWLQTFLIFILSRERDSNPLKQQQSIASSAVVVGSHFYKLVLRRSVFQVTKPILADLHSKQHSFELRKKVVTSGGELSSGGELQVLGHWYQFDQVGNWSPVPAQTTTSQSTDWLKHTTPIIALPVWFCNFKFSPYVLWPLIYKIDITSHKRWHLRCNNTILNRKSFWFLWSTVITKTYSFSS